MTQSTILFRKQGEQFCDANGSPIAGGRLYYYQAGTASQGITYLEQTGTVANSFPIILDSAGRIPTPVYLTTLYDFKETLTDPSGNTISPWPFDNIPKAQVTVTPVTGFERLYQPWVLVNSSNSPYTIAGSAAGTAYECDCSGGAVVINLPAVSATQTGTGFTIKKVDVSANTVTLNAAGADTIDGLTGAATLGMSGMCVGVTNDNAQWLSTLFAALPYMLAAQKQTVTATSSTLTIDMRLGWDIRVNLNTAVSTIAFTHWPASGTFGKALLTIFTGATPHTMTGWPGTTHWSGGAAPTISSVANVYDIILATSDDGGSTFFNSVVGVEYS
jgi:hypothetical protein